MGYYITQVDQNFIIPADKLGEAFEALKQTMSETLKKDYTDDIPTDAAGFFEQIGFEVDRNNGELSLDGYEEKARREDDFLDAVKHLVSPDSYIEFIGEDGDRYRWTPKGIQRPTITWGDTED